MRYGQVSCSGFVVVLALNVNFAAQEASLVAPQPSEASSNPDSRDIVNENLCGPNSILVAARMLGVSLDPEEVDRAFPSLERPATMLQLHEAATELGLATLPVHWADSTAPELPTPCIIALHVARNSPLHYVVLSGRVGDRYQVTEFGRRPVFVYSRILWSKWNGYALYLASDEKSLASLGALVSRSPMRRCWVAATFLGTAIILFWSATIRRKLGFVLRTHERN